MRSARAPRARAKWRQLFDAYSERYPQEAGEFERRTEGELPAAYFAARDSAIAAAAQKGESVATRKASQLALEALAPALPEIIGGSADLTGSNLTKWSKAGALRPDALEGRHINYGVREFGMCAISSGIAAHGGFLPFAGTFLTFSDYARNALRMAALMKLRVIYVFTHDSIGLGEDGPTHQAVEHAATLRLIPNMDVWRPADTVESLVAWAAAIERKDGPTSLLFSRQSLPFIARDVDAAAIRTRRVRHQRGGGRYRQSARGADRDRLRSRPGRSGAEGARRAGRRGARRVDAVDDRVRPAGRRNTNRKCCRKACRASRSRRASPISGGSTCARAAPSSASIASASRRPPRMCSSISASRSTTSLPPSSK